MGGDRGTQFVIGRGEEHGIAAGAIPAHLGGRGQHDRRAELTAEREQGRRLPAPAHERHELVRAEVQGFGEPVDRDRVTHRPSG